MPICAQFLPVSPLLRTLAQNCSFLSGFPSLGLLPRRKRPINAYGWRDCRRRVFAATDGFSSNNGVPDNGIVKKRNIVEHIFLLKAKPDLTDVEEKDMLDYLYTCQYQMRGILAISLGRIEEPNIDNFSHVVYMRFQKKEDLAKFYNNSYYSKVLEEHVTPFSYEFNYGVECLLLISILETASGEAVEDALAALQNLIGQFKSFIVQATLGHNLNNADSEYTHAAVIRFPSFEDFKLFKESEEYRDMWRLKIHPITRKALLLHFAVDPVGTELM